MELIFTFRYSNSSITSKYPLLAARISALSPFAPLRERICIVRQQCPYRFEASRSRKQLSRAISPFLFCTLTSTKIVPSVSSLSNNEFILSMFPRDTALKNSLLIFWFGVCLIFSLKRITLLPLRSYLKAN